MNEYEKLTEDGYTKEGNINLQTDNLTTMTTTTEAVSQDNNNARQDKTVIVNDRENHTKRVSSIMMGYNKAGIQLKDGEFVNADELLVALEQAVSSLEAGTIIINKKGEPLTEEKIQELFELAAEAAGKIVIKEQNQNITNQDANNWSVVSTDGREFKKGVVFLGNDGIQLTQGEYISKEEFLKALQEYMILKPPQETIPPIEETEKEEKEQKENKKTLRVTKKYKNKASAWLALSALLITLLLSLNIADKYVNIIETFQKHTIEYQIDLESLTEEEMQNLINQEINNLTLGETVEVKDGDEFYITSQTKDGESKTIGKEFSKEGKEAGQYKITGFSIVDKNGNVIAYIEDFNALLSAPNLGDFIKEVCEKNNLQHSDIEAIVHLGNNKDNTRLGWINVKKLIDSNDITQEMIESIVKDGTSFSGEIDAKENFITLDNGTTIQIKDANGNLITPGSTVIGSDGREYVINNLSEKTETNEIISQQKDGKKIVFDIQDANLALAAAPLIAAVGAAIANKKKNKNAQDNPEFFQFENDENYQQFLKEFQDEKAKYEKESSFGKMLKRIFYQKEVDIAQQLTTEQTEQLYTIIMQHNGKDYTINKEDKIEFKNGKIFLKQPNGSSQDITPFIMEDIKNIGKENETLSEGRLTDEIRRKH